MPIVVVAIGGDRADLRDLLGGVDLLGALLEVGDDRGDGDVDAALEIHRVHAGGDRLGAFLDDRMGEHGRGGGAVAGLSLVFWATSRTIWAPMFSNLSSSSISLATVTPSLVMRGRAEGLVEHDVAALGAERHFHGVGENVDAAQHAVAGVGGESYVFGCHGC